MNLIGLAQGLEDLGMIDVGAAPLLDDLEDAEPVWRRLAENAGGDDLIFLADGFYSAGWDESRLEETRLAVFDRLKNGEADLVLAFGTAAGLMMAVAEHGTAVMCVTATDPVAAGISATPESSGLPNVHVQVEAGKIERQLSMFHAIFRFKTLGVPLDVTPEGRGTMGLATIERAAAENDFELKTCETELEISDRDRGVRNLIGCLKSLSQEVDAVYLTVSNGMVESRLNEILAPLNARSLPTFSQKGPSETKLGVLMSLAEDDFISSGRFEAEALREIVSGRPPGEVGQLYVAPLTMALNFATALTIGWNPPFEILAAVDELYVDYGDVD
jgi:hypothetical protein